MVLEDVQPTDAASLVILKGPTEAPEVLLGRRRETARFMPGVYVFPGGAVDPSDRGLASSDSWMGSCHHAAALRETWEETGLMISTDGRLPNHDSIKEDPFYESLLKAGQVPNAGALAYIVRAITPPPSAIRFDTRFFLTESAHAEGVAHAVGELPEVRWVAVSDALESGRLRGVTKFVLSEALRLRNDESLADPDRPIRSYTWEEGTRIVRREPQSIGLS